MPFSFDPQPEENEIECARCGAYFFYDLTRCPECGVNIYEPDEEGDDSFNQNPIDEPRYQENLFSRIRNILRRISGKRYSAEEVFGDSLDQAILYNDLLKKVGGDHSSVERLLAYEQQKKPSDNRTAWLKNAIQRWESDNRVQGSSS